MMISNTRYKNGLKLFWIRHWKYERTPEQWVDLIDSRMSGAKDIRLLEMALNKLEREKKIDAIEKARLWEMIKSPDRENAIVAVTIMAVLKPRKFKKVLTQKP